MRPNCGIGPLILICACAGLLTGEALAQPSVASITPHAAAPGKTTEFTLTGAKLSPHAKVWLSTGGRVELVTPADVKDETKLSAKLHLDANTPVGVAGLVVATPSGATDVIPFVVDDLPSTPESGSNHSAATAQEVAINAGIDGTSDGNVFDYFRFNAAAGQQVSIDVLASRWAQDYDPVLRILNAEGREVAYADDDPAVGGDCRLRFTAPAAGAFVIELRDNRYKAGGKYRLRLGDFPLVTSPHPLAATLGVSTAASFVGPATDKLTPLSLLTPAGASPGIFALAAKSPSYGGAASAMISLERSPVILENEDDAQPPPSAPLPSILAGRFEKAGDVDRYQITASKGSRISLRATSKSLGSPAIVALRLLNPAGAPLAESAPTEADEETLAVNIPEDGVYQVVVSELLGCGGADFTYKLDVESGPTFQLIQKKDPKAAGRFTVGSGGAFYIDVQAIRGAYDGPIFLSLTGARGNWQVVNSVIAAKVAETRLYVLPPHDWSEADLALIGIEATGDASLGDRRIPLSRIANFRTARPTWPQPPAWADRLLAVSKSSAKPFYAASPDRMSVNFLRQLGQGKFTIQFERLDPAFKDVPLTLLFPELPPGIAPEVKRSAPGTSETYEVTLKGAKDLPEGRHVLRYFAFSEFQGRGQGEVPGAVQINVISPLGLSLAPAGPLAPGKTVKMKVAVTRRSEDRQPVEIKLGTLPAGVTGPAQITVPADQTEIEIELAAAENAALVKFDQLLATATSKCLGQDITAESPKAVLEIKAP